MTGAAAGRAVATGRVAAIGFTAVPWDATAPACDQPVEPHAWPAIDRLLDVALRPRPKGSAAATLAVTTSTAIAARASDVTVLRIPRLLTHVEPSQPTSPYQGLPRERGDAADV